jgi:hypothetical protein
LIVVTRNIADFRSFGVKLFNPFDGAVYWSLAYCSYPINLDSLNPDSTSFHPGYLLKQVWWVYELHR